MVVNSSHVNSSLDAGSGDPPMSDVCNCLHEEELRHQGVMFTQMDPLCCLSVGSVVNWTEDNLN